MHFFSREPIGHKFTFYAQTSAHYEKINFELSNINNTCISMTQLLLHTFAHLTGFSFRLKAKLLPIKNILGVKYN